MCVLFSVCDFLRKKLSGKKSQSEIEETVKRTKKCCRCGGLKESDVLCVCVQIQIVIIG